ncbi:hypothetical protein PaG_03120 [Moesziomyces aphidis]|uniref:Uncharacterized protein n=1 Tax=Moesziomyces aphidis TaxID=84754 RepID=W3VLF3_MOEAP|nr:hypothetical protein PaG_03120 [Moesziomyces aphidis]
MILSLLSASFVVCAGAVGLVCLALGLHSLSHYIETHAVRARVLGLRALVFTAIVQVLVVVVDDVPLSPLLPSLAAVLLHYRAISRSEWPFAATSSAGSRSGALEALVSLLLLPLTSHVWLMRSHALSLHAWHKHRYDTLHRPKLPGGRLDWDVDSIEPPGTRDMTQLQVCALLVVCVWSIPVYRLVGRIAAAEWGGAGGGLTGGAPVRPSR